MRAARTMGTFMRKTEPQRQYSRRSPPTTGPNAAASVARADQRPIARVLCAGSANEAHRMAGGQHGCRADRKEAMSGDEGGDVGAVAAEERGETEDDEADDEQSPVPDFVAEGAGAQEESTDDDGVGVDDPQHLGCGGIEFRH